MLLVDDLAAGGTKNLRHTPRGLVTLIHVPVKDFYFGCNGKPEFCLEYLNIFERGPPKDLSCEVW